MCSYQEGVECQQQRGRELGHRAGEPSWAAQRDPLYGQPLRQAQRMAAVMAIWGSKEAVWADIMHNTGRQRFIPSYLRYLQFR